MDKSQKEWETEYVPAKRIVEMEAEIKRLRDALRQIADKGDDNEYGLHQAMRQMALDALREE